MDGFRLGPTAPEHRAVVDGDEKSAAIAAASIVAKVTRDRDDAADGRALSGYGFRSHVGYITPRHSAVVRERGPCEIHRRSFQALCYSKTSASSRARGADAERRALWHYRLRGYRVLDDERLGRRQRARPGRAPRPPARLLRGEGQGGRAATATRRDGHRREAAPPAPSRGGLARRASGAWPSWSRVRRGGVPRRPAGAPRRRRSSAPSNRAGPWPRPRTRFTATSTSTSRGRSSDLPERERTKHVHRLHPYLGKFIPQLVEALLARHVPSAGACSIRSPAQGRRSCRRSSPGSTRRARTSRLSTAC